MLKKTITFENFDGEKITEDFYFNLSKAELIELEMSTNEGFEKTIERIVKTKTYSEMVDIFKSLILKSYGVKSTDGRRFIKSKEMAIEFSQTNAYSELFMELATNDEEATKFINGLMPKELVAEAQKALNESIKSEPVA